MMVPTPLHESFKIITIKVVKVVFLVKMVKAIVKKCQRSCKVYATSLQLIEAEFPQLL